MALEAQPPAVVLGAELELVDRSPRGSLLELLEQRRRGLFLVHPDTAAFGQRAAVGNGLGELRQRRKQRLADRGPVPVIGVLVHFGGGAGRLL